MRRSSQVNPNFRIYFLVGKRPMFAVDAPVKVCCRRSGETDANSGASPVVAEDVKSDLYATTIARRSMTAPRTI